LVIDSGIKICIFTFLPFTADMRILKEETAALLVDIQEKLFPHMSGADMMLASCLRLIEGLKVLSVPIIATQQYTKGLGPTIVPVREKAGSISYIEKISFSCMDEPLVRDQLEALRKESIILFGIEAHVCVLQTCIDLIAEGYQPVVVEDCISSRNTNDKVIAVERMRQEGALITTSESILFELTRIAGTGVFKMISGIIK